MFNLLAQFCREFLSTAVNICRKVSYNLSKNVFILCLDFFMQIVELMKLRTVKVYMQFINQLLSLLMFLTRNSTFLKPFILVYSSSDVATCRCHSFHLTYETTQLFLVYDDFKNLFCLVKIQNFINKNILAVLSMKWLFVWNEKPLLRGAGWYCLH